MGVFVCVYRVERTEGGSLSSNTADHHRKPHTPCSVMSGLARSLKLELTDIRILVSAACYKAENSYWQHFILSIKYQGFLQQSAAESGYNSYYPQVMILPQYSLSVRLYNWV